VGDTPHTHFDIFTSSVLLAFSFPLQTMGKPIIQHQAVGTILAEMAINVEAARALVWKSSWIKDSGGRNTYYSSMAKALASKAAVDNANSAVQVRRPLLSPLCDRRTKGFTARSDASFYTFLSGVRRSWVQHRVPGREALRSFLFLSLSTSFLSLLQFDGSSIVTVSDLETNPLSFSSLPLHSAVRVFKTLSRFRTHHVRRVFLRLG